MATAKESLARLTGYPVPAANIEMIMERRGVEADAPADSALLASKGYRLATADIYRYLVTAPDISQGGLSYNLSDGLRGQFRHMSNKLYEELGAASDALPCPYGYVGQRR